jgi:hypothetical protein
MDGINDPSQIHDPELREICVRAAWLPCLQEIIGPFVAAANAERRHYARRTREATPSFLPYGDPGPSDGQQHPPLSSILQSRMVRPAQMVADVLLQRAITERQAIDRDLRRWLGSNDRRWQFVWTNLIHPWLPAERWHTESPEWIRELIADDMIADIWQRAQAQEIGTHESTAHPPMHPADLEQPDLRAFAVKAEWAVAVKESANVLRDGGTEAVKTETDDIFARHLMRKRRQQRAVGDYLGLLHERFCSDLEATIVTWLDGDAAHRDLFRQAIVQPWQSVSGALRPDRPGWNKVMTSDALMAHLGQAGESLRLSEAGGL